MLDSTNPREKIPYIISTLDIRNILYLTYLDERLVALVILSLGLDIGIVPEAYNIVLVTELEYWHRDIWTTTDMDEDFWLFLKLRTIESMLEDIS